MGLGSSSLEYAGNNTTTKSPGCRNSLLALIYRVEAFLLKYARNQKTPY